MVMFSGSVLLKSLNNWKSEVMISHLAGFICSPVVAVACMIASTSDATAVAIIIIIIVVVVVLCYYYYVIVLNLQYSGFLCGRSDDIELTSEALHEPTHTTAIFGFFLKAFSFYNVSEHSVLRAV